MDINDLRSIIMVALFVCFITIGLWAYHNKQKGRFLEAANLPFEDEPNHQQTLEVDQASHSTPNLFQPANNSAIRSANDKGDQSL